MKTIQIVLLICQLGAFACTDREPIDYVDPFIGTGAHGHTYPGATTPFGGVQLSPDTRFGDWDACSGYHYSDSTILGFSHTHLSGTGCADLGDILFHPTSRQIDTTRSKRLYDPYRFSHKDETASVGYYCVELRDEDLRVELTAAPHTGIHRYTFAKGAKQQIAVDLEHLLTEEQINKASITQTAPNEIVGMRCTSGWVANQQIYFAAHFSEPIAAMHLLHHDRVALLTFNGSKPLVIKVGLSLVSVENARENLLTEVPDFDFDAAHQRARDLWRKALAQIVIEGGTADERTQFYTAMYHTKLSPNLTSDVNGDFRRQNQLIAKTAPGQAHYSTFSLWDTFRAWSPLMTLVEPELINNMIRSMLDAYDCTGELPVWPLSSGETHCMIGYHAVSVIAEAYRKGFRGFDAEKALEAMKQSAQTHRKGADSYRQLGYIPADSKREAVSCALEYAYDDWCIARMAEAMGDSLDCAIYEQRARSYENCFDGSTRFFRGKNADGSWNAPLEEFTAGRDYTEATAWQYRFFVPHDTYGLLNLFGGSELFINELDRLFTLETPQGADVGLVDITGTVGQYAHGNEPSHHMAYLFNYAGQPWKTQEWTRRLLHEQYRPTPDGISGNEDCGQMSAWYLLSSMGLYAVCPASGEFTLTTPLFKKATIQLGNGKILVIKSNDPSRNRYIDRVTLNGKPIEQNYVTYEALAEGGELQFTLTPQPNLTRGTSTDSAPYSMTTTPCVSIPYTTQSPSLFPDSLSLDLASATPDAQIHYTLDGSEPTLLASTYTHPLLIRATTTVKAKAFKNGYTPSATLTVHTTKANYLSPVTGKRKGEQGIRYTYYEGHFSDVAEIVSGKRIASGVMPSPSIVSARSRDHFGYCFEGFIEISKQGIWEFSTRSDDGSVLYIGNQLVVDNNGSHAAVTATGRIALKSGLHPIRILYFEDYEGEAFECGIRSPESDRFTSLSSDILYL